MSAWSNADRLDRLGVPDRAQALAMLAARVGGISRAKSTDECHLRLQHAAKELGGLIATGVLDLFQVAVPLSEVAQRWDVTSKAILRQLRVSTRAALRSSRRVRGE